jgi:hypothetical protein
MGAFRASARRSGFPKNRGASIRRRVPILGSVFDPSHCRNFRAPIRSSKPGRGRNRSSEPLSPVRRNDEIRKAEQYQALKRRPLRLMDNPQFSKIPSPTRAEQRFGSAFHIAASDDAPSSFLYTDIIPYKHVITIVK